MNARRTFMVVIAATFPCFEAPAADSPRTITVGEYRVALAFAPDGKAVAAASGNTLKLYGTADGKEVLAFTGHAWPVHSVVFSRDGKLLASGAGGFRDGRRGGEVRVWDAVTGKVKLTLDWWKGGDVQAVAFSPDGTSVAAGGMKGLRIWDAATGRLEKGIETSAAVLALAYAPDGKTLAVGSFTQHVHLWDTGTWKETALKGHKSEVRAVAFSPDGKRLVTGGVGELKVWDAGGELKKTIKHPDTVWSVAFSPDGKTVAVGSGQPRADVKGLAGLWNAATWEQTRRWNSLAGMASSVAFSPDGKRLAIGRYNGTVELLELGAR